MKKVLLFIAITLLIASGCQTKEGEKGGRTEGVWDMVNSIVSPTEHYADLRVPALSNCDTIDTDAYGHFSCGVDGGGGAGGSGVWATNTASTLIRPTNTNYVVVVGATATSSDNTILDVSGNSRIDGTLKVGAYTLPSTDGTADQVLKTDGSGALSWSTDTNTAYTGGTGITLTGTVFSTTDSEIVHDSLSGFVANEHLDWTGDLGATNIHSGNYTDNNTTYVSSDWTLSNITGYVANEHLDWTTDLGAVNLHAGNYTDNNTTYTSSDFTHDDLTGFVANEHLDWTASVGTIHAGNYTDTNTQLSGENVDDYVNLLLKDADSVNTRITLTYDDINNAFDFVVDDMNDDVPESGDFGNAGDLNADGTITDGVIDEADLDIANSPTDEYVLTYEADTTNFQWASLAGGGDITDVFNCTTGDCNTITIGTGEYLTYGTGYIDANRFMGVTTVDATEFGYLNGVSATIQTGTDLTDDAIASCTNVNSCSLTADVITDNLIIEADLNADETPANNDILTFDSTGANFSWQTPTELSLQTGTDLTNDSVQANELTLDYGAFTCNGTTCSLDTSYQPLEATLTDIADGTINENLVNTANPWADNEVSDTLTCSNLVAGSAVVAGSEIVNDTITHANIADSDQTDTKCIWFESPTADDDFKSIWANKTANNLTITEIWGESDQTVSFDLQIDDSTPADVSGTDIAPAAGEAEDTTLTGDTTLAAGEELDLIITSVSGTPTWVSICWTFHWND